MAVEIIKDLLKVSQVVGDACQQVIVDGRVDVPGEKPNILNVLSVEATLNQNSLEVDVLEDKVIIEGTIDLKVMYVAEVEAGDQPVHVLDGSVSFSNYVKLPGVKSDMAVNVRANIEHIQFNVNNPRAADVRIIMDLCAKATKAVEIEIVTDITGIPDLQVLTETLKVEDVIGEDSAQTIVRGDIQVPEDKPDIEQILKVDVEVMEKEVKVVQDKVIVDGTLKVNVLYVADVPEDQPQQPVHFMEGELGFTHFVDLPGAEPGMTAFVMFEVESAKGRRKDPRTVGVDAVIEMFAKITETQEVEVIVDAYSPTVELKVDKTILKVTQVIGEESAQVVVKDVLSVPNAKPDIEQIYNVKSSASIDETSILDDKVIIEGTLDVEMLYVAEVPEGEPQQPLHYTEAQVPFTQFVEIPGAKEGMDLDVMAIVEHTSFERRGPRQYEVAAVIEIIAKVTETTQIEVVTDVVVVEEPEKEKEEKDEYMPPEKPSMTIYIVQKGDTLWKIAKKYKTTVDAIVKANNIKNPDLIMPGQQLIIPR